jgi:acetate kinase
VRIDQKVLDELRPFAPLRQLYNLAAVRTTAAIAPSLPQVACFDTAYRPSQTEAARSLALPRETHDVCVRRFEFHELSHEYTEAVLRGRAAWRRRRGV